MSLFPAYFGSFVLECDNIMLSQTHISILVLMRNINKYYRKLVDVIITDKRITDDLSDYEIEDDFDRIVAVLNYHECTSSCYNAEHRWKPLYTILVPNYVADKTLFQNYNIKNPMYSGILGKRGFWHVRQFKNIILGNIYKAIKYIKNNRLIIFLFHFYNAISCINGIVYYLIKNKKSMLAEHMFYEFSQKSNLIKQSILVNIYKDISIRVMDWLKNITDLNDDLFIELVNRRKIFKSNEEIIEWLFCYDNRWMLDINDLFTLCCKYGPLDRVKKIYNKGIDIKHNYSAAFHRACESGHLNICKFLYEKGANTRGKTLAPFISARDNHHYDITNWLCTFDDIYKRISSYTNDDNDVQNFLNRENAHSSDSEKDDYLDDSDNEYNE